ncbi:gliding motility-associated C-terminal domain-containing protein [Flaviramulus sp. BrNp1-15]|uniref:Ig-like domain-containing protein n=1 Tax=Flaviramulus sp. BrNp1-15 TaxID=2916754 RepID=UPI001EE97B4C|nr:gliding motility-associated C-terminal domain-containing protein [Flaviramulus sp. BrNp1-15]ULC59421.1 gliding motility-associated C-terminal domain-containing protein [Flaviramulus sp. BrNp1-15]
MKTKSLLGYAKTFVPLIMVFLWTTFSVNAQCPTLNPSPPPMPICDASGYTFADLSADYALDGGDGIVWYDASSGGNLFNDAQLVLEGTYYLDNNSANCPTPRASIIVTFQVGASGENLDQIYCSNENATIQTYIDDVLQPSVPSGGSVEVYSDINLTTQLTPATAIPNGASNYFIVFIDNGSCESQIEIGQVGVFNAPADPTPANPQEFCSDTNPTIADLDPGTTATNYSWYANINGSGDPIPPALPLATPLVDGNTYYIQINDVFCVSNAVPVNVVIDTPVDAGDSAVLEYCNDSLPASDFNLFDELGGTPDTGGTWSGPLTTSNGDLGTVNISSLTTAGTYVFTYTVSSSGVCPDSTSNVSITVYETLTSGTPSANNPASFCESGLPASFDLFTLIENYDPDGQWTQGTTSSDPVVTFPIDLTGLTPNTYNFTYTQNLSPNPCPEESTTVQVIVLPDPDAGVAINQTFCENELAANSPFNLFDALDGSQDNNSGTWTDSNDVTISNSLNITTLTVAGSPYTYNYTIDNGTCSDTESITITVEPAPESGTVNAPVAFCEGEGSASFDLFTLLEGEDQTGTWNDDDSSGVLTGNIVDLSGLAPATYNFTYDVTAIGSCDDVDVTVSITINPLPNTGTPAPATFCENDLVANSPLDLFGQLTGEDAGGTWTDDDATGALSGSDVDLTLLAIGSYSFTYSITDANSCTNSSTVTITVEDAPESGTANAPVAFCEGEGSASFDLFTLLEGEDQTGTWNDDDASGVLTGNLVDLSGLAPATYNFTYDVTAIGSCDDVDVTVSITINPLPNTGTPAPATFCENDLVANSPLDLFGQLTGEDVGGTWTDDDTTGALSGSDVDLTLLTIGSYSFTYSITDANSCTNSSTVTITVEDAPESGTANTPVEFCISEITTGQTYDLFDLLEGEDQTGTWNDDDASAALSGNTVTLDGLAQGTYNFTYDVDAIGSCDDVDVTVSIVINDISVPTASTPQEFCDSATVADLVATGATIQWYADATGGSPLSSSDALVDGEDYFATQTDATTGCESSVRTAVVVTIYISPIAGAPNTTPIAVCNDDNNVDLFTGLDGTQDAGGTWNNDDGVGALTGNIFDATGVAAGTYNFTYTVTASSPCIDDSQTITVTINEPLDAGTDGTPLDLCSNDGTIDLFTQLGGTPDTGGTWSPALTSGTGVFDPLVDAPTTYLYTLTNACGTASSSIDVSVTLAPNAGTDNSAALCVNDDPIDLFDLLGTAAQSGGTWSPALNSGTGVFDPAVDPANVYIYTVTAVSPCSPDDFAEITVTVDDTPTPVVTDNNPEFCLIDNPVVSDLDSTISSSGTINWYEDAALTLPLAGTEALVDSEDYYATQTNGTGCESSTSVQIDVIIHDSPIPALDDANEEYCINDGPTIAELTSNISFDSTSYNIVWYDAATGGSTISSGTSLTITTYYAALVDITTGCESSVRLAVTPDLTACGKLRLPDGFSPNGDGTNDTYDVDNLAILYPNFEIEIYNRYGNIVYKGNANTPRFDGTSNQSRTLSKGDLPVGVYFYIFNFNDGENQPEQGRLYLSR